MDITWIIVFGVMGTGSLLFLCYTLLILIKNPYEFIRLNHEKCNSNVLYKYLILIAPLLALCFGMYHVVYFLLGWIPSDWGKFGEDGFVTTRSSLSTTLGAMAGFFISWAISKGIVARVHLSVLKLEDHLNKRIEYARNADKLKELQIIFEAVLAGDSIFVEDKNLYDAIEKSGLPFEALQELFSDAIRVIQQKSHY